MKILLFLVLSTSFAFSQCKEIIDTKEDKFNKVTTYITKKNLVLSEDGSNGIFLYIMSTSNDNSLVVTGGATGACTDKNSRLVFSFTDGTIMETRLDGENNCKGEISFFLGGMYGRRKLYMALKTKPLKSLKLTATQGDIEKEVPESAAAYFNMALPCFKIEI